MMRLDTVRLHDFRNYEDEVFSLGSGLNIVTGENAQGKTNFLEAIYYLSCMRSFKAVTKKEMIRFGSGKAKLDVTFSSQGRDYDAAVTLSPNGSPGILLNGVRLRRNLEFAGYIKSVLFSPDDLELVKGGASERRRFLDIALTQLRPRYGGFLSEYNRLLEHKTRILKDSEEKPSLLDTLDDFSFQMTRAGAQLIHYRRAFCRLLGEEAALVHEGASGSREKLTADYRTVTGVTDDAADQEQIEKKLRDHYISHQAAEIASRTCLSGPHKDDLLLAIDGRPARAFASQGQARTIALSLKMAERELFYKDSGEYPVRRLDDALSELDEKRQDFILHRITDGQVIITCCQEEKLLREPDSRIFVIENGRIVR